MKSPGTLLIAMHSFLSEFSLSRPAGQEAIVDVDAGKLQVEFLRELRQQLTFNVSARTQD